ncbi:MAG: 2-(1,2-epoxy,2-dihydrophenyl)acetyl-CoA isomerase [Chloroflexia bacterium]|jgi:2-(1,2-epoxy-1,2-dihydrophenyl)acetyl-CoA isomerase|nr:2-(1,2-epoxy,2-dihydrophenyl)acetyl-CoA isomerase [Chloroflexia bacterium]
MEYETIFYNLDEGVLTITLNRPDVLNAFNRQMTDELQDAFKKAERDSQVRCIVLTGAGRAFSSGEDLKSRSANGETDFGSTLRQRYNPLVSKMRNIDKPVLGSINGVAAGAGCSIALACDLRIASDKARFMEVFVRVGLVPDSGSSFFLPRLVGLGKALEMAFLGDEMGADEALRTGLVNRVVPAEELEGATRELALRLAKAPTKAIGLAKRAVNRALTMDLDQVLEYEVYGQEAAGASDDHKEGLAAFLEKRTPNFTGR